MVVTGYDPAKAARLAKAAKGTIILEIVLPTKCSAHFNEQVVFCVYIK